jgi:hypothetical protein
MMRQEIKEKFAATATSVKDLFQRLDKTGKGEITKKGESMLA